MLIQNGLLIDPSQKIESLKDIRIVKGLIESIDNPGKIPPGKNEDIIDAKGLWVTPGFIDMHVHLREPGEEFKESIASGAKAAAMGGFTSIACMANTKPVNDHPSVTKAITARAAQESKIRIFPIGAVSRGLKGESLAEIAGLVQEGCVAISDDGMPIMNSQLMRNAMEYSKTFDIPIISHAEDITLSTNRPMNEGAHSTRLGLRGNPPESEEIMVNREISLARMTQAKVHIAHLSTQLALDQIRIAKKNGIKITAEVTPHHLVLNDESIEYYHSCHKMAPPLRSKNNQEILIQGLNEGWIDAIASDHAPHDPDSKALPFDCCANGILGLQTTLPLTLDLVLKGKLNRNRWVEALTQSPSQILNLSLGSLKPGCKADLTLIDPELEWVFNDKTNFSKSQNSPFWGKKMKGRAVKTIVQGRIIYEC